MSRKELDILMQRKDSDGNIEIHYPITKAENVKNLNDQIKDIVSESGEYISISEKGAARGVAQLDDGGKVPPSQLPEMNYDTKGSAATVQTNLNSHTGNKSNPHGVTKAQVGLGNVANTSDVNKPVSTAQKAAIDGVERKADKAQETADSAVTAAQNAQASADNAVKAFGKKLIATFKTSGTFRLTNYGLSIGDKIDLYIVGGGGGGGVTSYSGGGGGGYCRLIKDFTLAAVSYSITIGAGGTGGTASNLGSNGGTTTAFGYTALGGSAGNSSDVEDRGNGGSGGGGPGASSDYGGDGGAGGGCGSMKGGAGGGNENYTPVNPYDGIAYGCGGGGTGYNPGKGGGAGGAYSNTRASNATGLGGGGGGGFAKSGSESSNGGHGGIGGGGGGGGSNYSYTAVRGGSGGSGLVYIYAAV